MAVRDDPMTGENCVVKIFRWKEKELCGGTVNGSNTDFTVTQTPVNLLNIKSTLVPDFVVSSTSFAMRDFALFYRKNGVDTRVDESVISITGSTVTITPAPSTANADNVVMSYAYSDTSNDGTTDFTYYVKDYSVKGGGRDTSEVKVSGGKSYKRVGSQGLTEGSLTTIKKDVLLSQILNGDLIKSSGEVTSLLIKSTVGGSSTTPRLLIIVHTDPDNSNDKLISIMRNVRGTANEWSGAADKEVEETITVTCNPEDYAELELNQIG